MAQDGEDLGKHPRILVNIKKWLKANPLKTGGFDHYRPARYFAENIATLGPKLNKATLDRFEAAFKVLNELGVGPKFGGRSPGICRRVERFALRTPKGSCEQHG